MGERPVRVELLTNRTGAAGRRRLSAALAAGEVDIVVGTHALIYDTVAFPALGVAVIDEQHRFGVEQRALLRAKGPGGGGPDGGEGPEPDVLVMTATPIPRTAAMLIYGDLDKSELREMPPGRTPITTDVIGPSPLERAGAYQRLRDQVAAGPRPDHRGRHGPHAVGAGRRLPAAARPGGRRPAGLRRLPAGGGVGEGRGQGGHRGGGPARGRGAPGLKGRPAPRPDAPGR